MDYDKGILIEESVSLFYYSYVELPLIWNKDEYRAERKKSAVDGDRFKI
jgi:hypothetical protein